MCFSVCKNRKPTARIAKKDIQVWKLLDDRNSPSNNVLKVRQENKKTRCESYRKGYVYTEEAKFQLTLGSGTAFEKRWEGNEGFHSYVSKPMGGNIREFRIPKGTKYYVNDIHYFSKSIQRIS